MRRTIGGVLLAGNVVLLEATSRVRDGEVQTGDCEELDDAISIEVGADEAADRTTTGLAPDTGAPPDTAAEPEPLALTVAGYAMHPHADGFEDARAAVVLSNRNPVSCSFAVYLGDWRSDLDAFPQAPAGIPEPPDGWSLVETGEVPAGGPDPLQPGSWGQHEVELPAGILEALECGESVRVAIVTCEGTKVRGEVEARVCGASCELDGMRLERL